MAGEGLGWCVMEVSSHALAQGRVSGLEFEAGIFTNLGSDHLDYHKTPEAYAAAKRRLFDENGKLGGQAIVNLDDPFGRILAETIPNRTVTTYGVERPARVSARHIACTWQGVSFVLESPWGTIPLSTPLLGRQNVWNILGAASALLSLGVPPQAIRQGAAEIEGVPGRLERVPSDGGPIVLIDYAHTPEALRQVLLAVRELCRGRILVVFGCGGDRDQTKRAPMGQVASLLADHVVLTSDNPRSEDPHLILRQIRTGFVPTFESFQVIPDREQAIVAALTLARSEDTVIIAGKGHEAHQTFARVSVPFVDRDVARRWLGRRQALAVT
jgi:UDP-N-acetylmuramoyl-L-alanyl-D-glutamate--2,6-diaminopimelate ligase